MNRKYFNIYKKYRTRKYENDLEYIKMESGLKGEANINAQKRLKNNLEDELEMENEKTIESEEEQKILRIQRFSTNLLAIIALLSFLGTIYFSSITIKNSKEANNINKLASEQQYYNQQPFIIITSGNEDVTDVRIKNIGGGPAKDIFFLKHHGVSEAAYDYALTKEKDLILGMAEGAEGSVNLNSQSMDELNENEVLKKVQCLSSELLAKKINTWVMIFYRNMQGELFASRMIGTGSLYGESVIFEKINCD